MIVLSLLATTLGSISLSTTEVRDISPQGAAVRDLAASTRNPLLSLAALNDGRVLRSRDAGASYGETPLQLSSQSIQLGWDAGGYAYAFDVATLHVSSDGGATWTARATPGSSPTAFAASPTRPLEIWVGDGAGNVYQSLDAGETWGLAGISLGTFVRDIELHPTQNSIVGAYSDTEFALSTDGGLTASPVALPEDDVSIFSPAIETIEFIGQRVVFMWSFVPFSQGIFEYQIYTSDDFGDAWSLSHTRIGEAGTSLQVDPTEPGALYFSYGRDEMLYKSSDSGSTWASVPEVPDSIEVTAFAFPSGPGTDVLLGTDFGVLNLDGQGSPLDLASGAFGALPVRDLVQDPTDPEHLVALSFLPLESYDGGLSWEALEVPFEVTTYTDYPIAFDSNGVLYISFGKIYRRSNGLWVDLGLTSVREFEIGQRDQGLIVAIRRVVQTGFLSVSRDGGQTWSSEVICRPFGSGQSCTVFLDELQVVERPGLPTRVVVSVDNSYLMYTDDDGVTLNYFETAPFSPDPTLTARGQRYPEEMIAGFRSTQPALISGDAFSTTSLVGSGAQVGALAVGSGLDGAIVRYSTFPPTSSRLQVSYDRGATWSDIDGLPSGAFEARSLLVRPNDNELLVTGDYGILAVELAPTVSNSTCEPTAPNSRGLSAVMTATGSRSIAESDVSLDVERLPRDSTCLFLGSLESGFAMSPGGSVGNLCLGGAIGRFPAVMNSGVSGAVSLELDPQMLPQPTGAVAATAGDSWFFQLWYRDSFGGLATSHFSSAIELVWE